MIFMLSLKGTPDYEKTRSQTHNVNVQKLSSSITLDPIVSVAEIGTKLFLVEN